jgi:hypothetical protein
MNIFILFSIQNRLDYAKKKHFTLLYLQKDNILPSVKYKFYYILIEMAYIKLQ